MTHQLLLLKFPPDTGSNMGLLLPKEKEGGAHGAQDPRRDGETEAQTDKVDLVKG